MYLYSFIGTAKEGKTQGSIWHIHKLLACFYTSDESGQMVEDTLAFEHHLHSHLMDLSSVNETHHTTSQKMCTRSHTLPRRTYNIDSEGIPSSSLIQTSADGALD